MRKKSTPSFGWTPSENDRINPEIYWAGKKLPSKPTAAAPVAKPAATVVAAKTYTVKSGDTLGKIATDNKMTLDELLKKNPEIKNASQVSIGQIIKL
ncbi:MAG: LysM domain-containing protein [Caulobacteraceae bacterium]|nr:LysM domain-containing protein [Caulobacteraceae bacterium]